MNAILFLVVFVGALAAVWVYPAVCFQKSAGETKRARRWLGWIPLINLYLLRPTTKTIWGALLLLALVLLTLLSINWSQTVNGRTVWRLDSRWLFMALIALAAATLTWTFWRRWKANSVANKSLGNSRHAGQLTDYET